MQLKKQLTGESWSKNVLTWTLCFKVSSVQFSSVIQSCPTLCDPMDCSTPGFLVRYQFLDLGQIHVHRASDAIHPSSSVLPFSSCLQSFPASGSFPMSQLLASGGQSIGASASASVLPVNIQDWFPLWLTAFDLFAVQGNLKSLLQHHSSKALILWCSAFFIVQLSYLYMTTRKSIALTNRPLLAK